MRGKRKAEKREQKISFTLYLASHYYVRGKAEKT